MGGRSLHGVRRLADIAHAHHVRAKGWRRAVELGSQTGRPPVRRRDDDANLDTLATELSDGKDKIEEALKSTSSAADALGAISTVSATVATMGHNVTATVDDMKQLDPKGELEQAFHQAAACSPLFD